MNKQDEKKVLRMVYKESAYVIVDEACEKPDFILKDSNNVTFGVEVTEHFYTEAAARLIKVPNYLERLLDEDIQDENRYMDWRDRKILKVDNITVLDEQGIPTFETKAIIQDNPPWDKYLESIEAVIKLKNVKSKDYNPSTNNNNLIIYDRAGGFDLLNLEDFYEAFYTCSVISTLQNSLFKEISLIISHKEDKYYFNLKEYLLLSKVFLFICYYENTVLKLNTNAPILYFIIDLLYCLDKDGFENVGINFEAERIEILYGCTGFEIFKNKVIDISLNRYDFVTIPMFSNIADFLQHFKTIPNESLFQGYKDYEKEKAFKCNCAFLCHS